MMLKYYSIFSAGGRRLCGCFAFSREAAIKRLLLRGSSRAGGGLISGIHFNFQVDRLRYLDFQELYTGLTFYNCIFDYMTAHFSCFDGVEFINCRFLKCAFSNCALRNVKFTSCRMGNTRFNNCELSLPLFDNCFIDELTANNTRFCRPIFRQTELYNGRFAYCNVEELEAHYSKFISCNVFNSILCRARFESCSINSLVTCFSRFPYSEFIRTPLSLLYKDIVIEVLLRHAAVTADPQEARALIGMLQFGEGDFLETIRNVQHPYREWMLETLRMYIPADKLPADEREILYPETMVKEDA